VTCAHRREAEEERREELGRKNKQGKSGRAKHGDGDDLGAETSVDL
jgi:hypothetical protein